MIDACVVDATVGIKLFVQEEDSQIADRLFARLAETPLALFYVPDLFYIECANILWKYVRNFGYPADNARQDVNDLQKLALLTASTADLIPTALHLALAHDITAYDACYAALAQQTNLPLVTADGRLVRKLEQSELPVRSLSDLKPDAPLQD